jgi:hypothetical protein
MEQAAVETDLKSHRILGIADRKPAPDGLHCGRASRRRYDGERNEEYG